MSANTYVNATMIVHERFSIKAKEGSVAFPQGQFRVGLQLDVEWPKFVFEKQVADRFYFLNSKNEVQTLNFRLERGKGEVLRQSKDFNLYRKFNSAVVPYGEELTENRSCVYERQVVGEHCAYKEVDECPSMRGIDGICVGWPDAKIEEKLVCEDEIKIIYGVTSVKYRMADVTQSEDYIFKSKKTSKTIALIQGDVRSFKKKVDIEASRCIKN